MEYLGVLVDFSDVGDSAIHILGWHLMVLLLIIEIGCFLHLWVDNVWASVSSIQSVTTLHVLQRVGSTGWRLCVVLNLPVILDGSTHDYFGLLWIALWLVHREASSIGSCLRVSAVDWVLSLWLLLLLWLLECILGWLLILLLRHIQCARLYHYQISKWTTEC